MPFIPFLTPEGAPIVSLAQQTAALKRVRKGLTIHVDPSQLEKAKMVIHNDLMEQMLDHLLHKPKNEQSQYEAEALVEDYWRRAISKGGLEW